jgi:AcrR family transcriptional regulator
MLDSPGPGETLILPRFTERGEGREGQILVAAYHCIAEIGIAATTTRAVARRANLNQGSIHYYFASKDELLLGVMKGLMSNNVENARTVRLSNLSPTRKIYAVLRSGENFILHGREVAVSVTLWAHALSQGGIWQETYRTLFDQFRAELVPIIEDGIAKGEFHVTDPKPVAETVITAVQGVGMHYLMNPADFAGESVGDRLAGLFWKILGVKDA